LTKQDRYLITTADEATWKYDRPIIFLGEWCRLYDRKHVWKNLDAILAKPYGLGKSKKDSDYFEVKKLEQKLFPEFCEILNQHFNLSYSKKYWQIIHGHWFADILQLFLNRINTLKQCFQFYKISGTSFYKDDNYNLATLDNISLYFSFGDDRWNNILNAQIIKAMNIDLSNEFLEYQNKLGVNSIFKKKSILNDESFKVKILKWCLNKYNKISRKFLNDKDAFIINSYLPTILEAQLELALGQWPQLWSFQQRNFDLSKIENLHDKLLRQKLTKEFSYGKSKCDFENIVRLLLFEIFPICYLEGFNILKELSNQQLWPTSPKFIFTSNNYYYDELFKLWTASKVELGLTKYYVGQHGNNYSTRRNFSPQIEEITSDKMITWGSKKGFKYFPAFIFKTVKSKKKNYNPKGGLVLIQEPYWHRFYTWDIESEYVEYFEDQKKFVKTLNNGPKNNLTIRLERAYQLSRRSEKEKWFDFDSSLKLDTGKLNIKQLILKNRLVVHSYDSTGLLETLSQNIPTLAFWQNGLDHLDDNATHNYQLLVDAGIVYLSAESAANKVNDIWDDVDGWWSQIYIQNARKQFCELYAKESNNPVSELKKILLF
jgi:putative transferase (TIGR04331 family)